MPRPFFLAGTLFSLACFGALAVAQPAGSSQSSSSDSQQGNSASSSPKTKSDPSAKPQEKKKPKKVWTNDDVGGISGSVSVVGNSSEAAAGKPEDKRPDPRGHSAQSVAASFRRELQSLRAQLDQVEKQISDLRSFKADNTSPSGGIKMGGRYNMVPLEEQVRQLDAKRRQIQARIDDVENQARKLGIDPGDLR